ncbi:glycosyltransferase family 25 protein [Providencia rettgeri]
MEWAIIFEDDVQIDKKLLDLITYKKNELKKANIYILGGQDGLPSREMIVTSKRNKILISNGMEFEKTNASSKYIYRTCCYLIHRELAQNILEQRKRCFFLADDWHFLYKRKIVKSFYITNCVTHPIDLKNSVIQNERDAYKNNNFIQNIKNSKLRKYKIALRRIIYG